MRVKIEDWTITSINGTARLFGKVFGHPRIMDGHRVSTSEIINHEDGVITTHSGTEYELGTPLPDAVKVWQEYWGIPNGLAEVIIR